MKLNRSEIKRWIYLQSVICLLAKDQCEISRCLTWPDQFTIPQILLQVSAGIFGFDLIQNVSGAQNIINYIIHQARWKEGREGGIHRDPWDSEHDVICQD